MGYCCYSTFNLRMVDMIEKYKEDEPEEEFAELDVMERIEAKFIVREKNCEGNLAQYIMLQENWFYVLEKELEKVTSFYREKKAEAMRKFNTLKEQLSLTEEPHMRNNQVR